MGLVAIRADISDDIDKEYESSMYFCRLKKDLPLATSGEKQYIHKNVNVGAIMLPHTRLNVQF